MGLGKKCEFAFEGNQNGDTENTQVGKSAGSWTFEYDC